MEEKPRTVEIARPSLPEVADPSEFDRIAECVGRAFHDDPIAAFLFPNERHRVQRFARVTRITMKLLAQHGLVVTTPQLQGAAIWQAPAPPRPRRLQLARPLFQLLCSAGFATARALRLGEATRRHHPREPHWYLSTLATEPAFQGQGIGSALLSHTLAECDRSGVPAYLESSKESNVPFYQRHGFVVTGEIHIIDGPTLWPMCREAG